MPKEYFFLYLIYGSAFISMGLFALQKHDVEVSNFPMVQSLKYLGFFGISHGVSEWVTMLVIADLYPDAYTQLFILKQILKSFSFAFLMYFGLSLLPYSDHIRAVFTKLPVILLSFWLGIFFFLMMRYGWDYHLINPEFNTIYLRYLMGFSGGILTATALFIHAKLLSNQKLKNIAIRYRGMASIFLVYSILDGLIVREVNFFPASIVNNELFLQVFKFPIQIAKTMVGIGISVLLIGVIKTFGWEQKEKLQQLQNSRITYEERRKLGLELHDVIIQGLYSAGLKTEYVRKNKMSKKTDELLDEIKDELNTTIDKTRAFIASTSLKTIELDELVDSIQQLVNRFSNNINITLSCKMPTLSLRQLSPAKSTQIYYIIQEAITNVVKHASATEATVLLTAKYNCLLVQIFDNGIGVVDDRRTNNRHLGLESMKQRAESVGGLLKVEKIKSGTRVEFQVPWEELDYAGED